MRTVRPFAHTILLAAAACCLLGQASGQYHKEQASSKGTAARRGTFFDPYTRNEEAALEQAGYVSYAPFCWADGHSTDDIDQLLPYARFLWVETAHFKIGSSLPRYRLSRNPHNRQKIRNELKELKHVLSRVRPRTRELDRWLRLHLFAMRLEKIYADFQALMGVTDRDTGRYLGMGGKYHVVLCTKASTLGRYSRYATGRPHDRENAHQFQFKDRSLFFGTNLEIGRGSLFDDDYLHLQVVFSVSGMLLDGYKGNTYNLPPWLRQGLGNWFVRCLDPEEEFFYGIEEFNLKDRDKDHTDWAVTTRQLVQHGGGFKPAEEILSLRDAARMNLEDQMTAWSRCDFLIKHDRKKFARFMDLMKVDLPHESMKLPPHATILENQRQALQQAYGFDYSTFEAAWRQFVTRHYPRK